MIKLTDKIDCCGCTACASACGTNAITMRCDEEGFLYPVVNVSLCTNCGLCERVCPIILRDKADSQFPEPLSVYALYNRNAEARAASSSGGVFVELAAACLAEGGIVYGAEYDENFKVVHRGYDNAAYTARFRGSKYVQSDMRGIYREIRAHLKGGRRVLFSGTPCQVDGLKSFLRRDYDSLLTVDILCHGTPSPLIFADYIRFINRYSPGILKGVFMKDKTFGWGYQNLRLYFRNGRTEFNSVVSNLWNRIFYDHIVNRPVCHACRWTNLHRAGDLTIGDFWGIEKSHPEINTEYGVSLLLVNSAKGLTKWQEISKCFQFFESNIEECLQPVLCTPTQAAPDRVSFWTEYKKKGFVSTMRQRYGISGLALAKNYLLQMVK